MSRVLDATGCAAHRLPSGCPGHTGEDPLGLGGQQAMGEHLQFSLKGGRHQSTVLLTGTIMTCHRNKTEIQPEFTQSMKRFPFSKISPNHSPRLVPERGIAHLLAVLTRSRWARALGQGASGPRTVSTEGGVRHSLGRALASPRRSKYSTLWPVLSSGLFPWDEFPEGLHPKRSRRVYSSSCIARALPRRFLPIHGGAQ